MKISDELKSLFQRRPPAEEKLAARAEAEAARAEAETELEDLRQDFATRRNPTEGV